MVRLTLILVEHFLSSYWLIGEVLVSDWTYLPINLPVFRNVFSQSKAINLIVLKEYTPKVDLYLAMNCYLFDVQMNFCYTQENSQFDLVEFGPLNMIDPHLLSLIARTLQSISIQDVTRNWWTDFSTWRDFQALIRTGTLLSVHKVVEQIGTNFGKIHDADVTLEMIDDNGNMEIMIIEDTKDMLQGFTVKARRRRLRRLKDIAAFNLAQHLASEDEIESLNIPESVKPLVKKFLVTFSGNYMIDMNTN